MNHIRVVRFILCLLPTFYCRLRLSFNLVHIFGGTSLTKISDEVGPDRSLLICCGSFRASVSEFENLTVKKIPKLVLKKCEWGHDDYSLEVQNLPAASPEYLARQAEQAAGKKPTKKYGKEKKTATLFDTPEGEES